MKIKNLKKSLAFLTAAVLLAASIPLTALDVFAVSNTYDITYEDGVTTVGGVKSTVADAFKVLEIKDTTTEYSEEATEDEGKLSIPVSTRTTTLGDNTGSYMFTLQNAPARDLLSYELTIPTKDFKERPSGLLIPLYYDEVTNRYVSVFSVTRSGNTFFQIGRAFITTKYYGYYKNADTEVGVTYSSVSNVNVKVSYNYQDDTISSVVTKFVLYDSSNTELATLSKTYTKAEILQAVNINSSTTGLNGKPSIWEEEDVNVTSLAKSGALAGFISGATAGTMNTISSFKASYSKSAGDVAAEFVNEYKSYITMDESAVTADNANGVIAAHSAYTALDEEVKTVLASYEIDGASYNVGEKLAALIAVAAPFVPTAAQTAFEEYYNANIEALNAADGKLAEINTALGLYNAVEVSHKANVSTQYAHICSLLDGYFITDNATVSTKDLTYDSSSLTGLDNVKSYFKNSVFVETENSRNNKVTDPAKFDSTKAHSIKVAFTYGEKNEAGTGYKTGIGFNLLPVVGSIDGLKANSDKKMFAPSTRANKEVYVNGVSVGSGKSVYGYQYADNNFAFIENVYNDTANQFFKSKGNIAGIEWLFGSYSTSASKYQESAFANTYQLPADRIVFDFDYTVTTTVDAQGYKLLTITFSNITVWAESDGNNSYDEGVDIILTTSSGAILAYRYNEETAPLPYFSTDDASLDSMLYFKSTAAADYSFEEKYADLLNGTSTDAARTLEMYAEYQADTSAVSAETAAKVEAAVTSAGLRPTANGATLSVSADTHIGFYVDKPAATAVESTVGAIASTYNYMVENGISVLTKGMGDAGVLEATPESNAYCGENQLMLKVKNLYGAANNWGNWIVVRYYASYTVNGNEVVIYSTGENANNPASATEVSRDGVAIRSINYLIKCIAAEMQNKVATNGDTVGVDYVDKDGATKSVYTGKTLSTAFAENSNSTIYSTALDTMYFLMSYKNAL